MPKTLTKSEKDSLVQSALLTVTRIIKRLNGRHFQGSNEPRMYCSLCALVVLSELRVHNVKAMFQAGSAGWRMVPADKDDGVSPTHFWHKFEPEAALIKTVQGEFPEAHCWVAIPDESDPEFIDITTAVLPIKASMHGFTWLEAQPPSYLWLPASQLPDGYYYKPTLQACNLCSKIAMQALHLAAAE